MAYTQSDIDALRSALAKGIRRARLNGEEVEFNSPSEMRRQLREMEAELSGVSIGQPTVSYARTSRGL
jgi:hypothetical protein